MRLWMSAFVDATCKSGSLLSRDVPTLKCNVASTPMASEMTTECVSTECTEMPDGIAVEGDVLPDLQIPEVVLVRTSLQIFENFTHGREYHILFKRGLQT